MGSLPAWCACAGDLRGRQSLAEDPFFKVGVAAVDRQSPQGTLLVFRSAWSTGWSHCLLSLLFLIGQGLPPGKPDPLHFPSSPLCPTPGQLFFFFFLVLGKKEVVFELSTPKQQGALPHLQNLNQRFLDYW